MVWDTSRSNATGLRLLHEIVARPAAVIGDARDERISVEPPHNLSMFADENQELDTRAKFVMVVMSVGATAQLGACLGSVVLHYTTKTELPKEGDDADEEEEAEEGDYTDFEDDYY